MPLTTDIANLSQTASFNNPDGATDAPSVLDDQLRYHGSFIAKLRDGAGYSAGAIPAALGFTPVRAGGIAGSYDASHPIYIGFNPDISRLVCQVDTNSFSNTWPIDISGTAATANNASNASNANALGGVGSAEFVRRWSNNAVAVGWSGTQIVISIDGNTFGGVMPIPIDWSYVQNRPTALSQFTNNIGAITNATTNGTSVQANLVSGQTVAWNSVIVSDESVKKNIAPTREDSLAKVAALDFVAFDFDLDKDPTLPTGHQNLGIMAQQAQHLDPSFVQEIGGRLHRNDPALLMAALHAIQQLRAEVQELRALVAPLEAR